MLTRTELKFTGVFTVLLIAELVCVSFEEFQLFHFISKPALVISLLFFFYTQSTGMIKSLRLLTIGALLFSLMGDVALLFVEQSPHFFMLGLASFLVAQLFYILVFLSKRNHGVKPYALILFLLSYAFLFFMVVKDHLGELFLPVIIYMLVILGMALTAGLRRQKVTVLSYILVFIGAGLFIISDSILALNKFYSPVPFSGFLIMLTYALAQYFIVIGLLKDR